MQCRGRQQPLTHAELGVEQIHGLVVPGVLGLQVDGVQDVLDEGHQHHRQQDLVLEDIQR